jgi:branched-subunit amino acid ABC-type transport system permease component
LFTNIELGILLLAGISMTGMHVLLKYTILGKSMRAMADNTVLARLCGVPTSRVTDAVWVISGILASLGGVALALSFGVFDVQTGLNVLFVVLAAIVVGGIGRPYGTMIGALIIGLAIEVSTNVISPAYKLDVAFAVLIVALLVRPQGISRVIGRV